MSDCPEELTAAFRKRFRGKLASEAREIVRAEREARRQLPNNDLHVALERTGDTVTVHHQNGRTKWVIELNEHGDLDIRRIYVG